MVHVPLMFLSEWREFPSAPCRGGETLDDSSRLHVVEIARHLTCFLSASVTRKTCNSAHEQTPLSNNTIDSVLRRGEVGRAKDLSASPRKDDVPPFRRYCARNPSLACDTETWYLRRYCTYVNGLNVSAEGNDAHMLKDFRNKQQYVLSGGKKFGWLDGYRR